MRPAEREGMAVVRAHERHCARVAADAIALAETPAARAEMRYTALHDVIGAARDVHGMVATEEKPYAVVVVIGNVAEAVGAYAKRSTADGMCTRTLKGAAATTRAFTVAPRAGGGVVVMSGPVVIGSTEL